MTLRRVGEPLCPFCERARSDSVTARNPAASAFRDKYPIATGHTLVVPVRHVESIFDLPGRDLGLVWDLVAEVRELVSAEVATDGFNIGVNDGKAAGQTVPHAHVHVVPRFFGDVDDPRGGLRWVLPERARYW